MKDLSNKNVIHIKKGNVQYLQFRKLLEYTDLLHAFTLKPIDVKNSTEYEENKERAIFCKNGF